jgi:diaminopropionate ammonia-lyase
MTACGAHQTMTPMRFFANPHSSRAAYTADEAQIISVEAAVRALKELRTWPGYGVSPLRELPDVARRLGVESVSCKDESQRFGLGSFKALGGAYAVGLALRRRKSAAALTLCCATDGNHGRSVASGARRHGCRCVIFVHEHALESKVEAMRALGAEVVRIAGNYDDSVHHAQRTAAEKGWVLISDTSDCASDQVAADVMKGYAVMNMELNDQLHGRMPTHVFVQAGVGGLAAAVAGCFAQAAGASRPIMVVVEPEAAACVMRSAVTEGPSRITGNLATTMAMLSCGETSAPAWVILRRRADAFVTVSDAAAEQAVAWLAATPDIPGGLATTPSGAAGLAGVMTAINGGTIASQIGLNNDSRVLIFVTEGVDHAVT